MKLLQIFGLAIFLGQMAARADFSIDWSRISAGAIHSQQTDKYEISGTIGQPDAGEIPVDCVSLQSGFWVLILPSEIPPDVAGSEVDLAVAIDEAADPVLINTEIAYSIRVINRSPVSATGVRVTNTIPAGMQLISAASIRPLIISGSQIIFELGRVRQGGCAFFRVVLQSDTQALYTNSVFIAADQSDPVPFDNLAAQATTVLRNPAQISHWIGGSSSSWNDAANWTAGVPGFGDTAILPSTANVNVPTDVTVAVIKNAATSFGGAGNILITVAGEWTAGSWQGPGAHRIAPGALFDISGAAVKGFFYHTIDNAGILRWSGTGPLNGHSAPVLNNFPGGLVEISSDAVLTRFNNSAIFNNHGILRKIGDGSLQRLDISLLNAGRVQLDSGRVEIMSTFSNRSDVAIAPRSELLLTGGGASRGHFQIGTNAFLTYRNGSHLLEADTVVEGDGFVRVDSANAILSVNGAVGIENLQLAAGTLGGDGPMTVSGLFEWTGGVHQGPGLTRIQAGATLDIAGPENKGFYYRTIENAGAINWDGSGAINGHSGPVLNNLASGVITVFSDAPLTRFNNSAIFNNHGILRKIGDGSLQRLDISLLNAGRVQLDSGRVEIMSTFSNRSDVAIAPRSELLLTGGGASRGHFQIGTNAFLTYRNGSHLLEADTVVEGDGFVRVDSANAILSVNGAVGIENLQLAAGTLGGDGPMTVSGLFEWTGGVHQGPGLTRIQAGATLDIAGPENKGFYYRTIENAGAINWDGSGAINGHSGPVLNNLASGVITVFSDAPLTRFNNSAIFNNHGILRKIGDGSLQRLDISLLNAGRVQLDSGRVEIMSTFSNRSDVAIAPRSELLLTGGGASRGHFQIGTNAFLTYRNGSHLLEADTVVEGDGFVRVDSANAILSVNGAVGIENLQLAAGTLGGDGPMTVSGLFEWTGGVHQGPGLTRIQAGATLDIAGPENKGFYYRTIENAGAINWDGSGAINGHSGPVLNNLASGVITVFSDAPLTRFNSAAVINNAGHFRKLDASGTKRMEAVFSNFGLLSLESGILSLGDRFVPSADSVVRVTLAGPALGSGYPRLELAANLDLTGKLEIAMADTFAPEPGATFPIITTPSRAGTFSSTAGGQLGSLILSPLYTQTSVTLATRQALRLDIAGWVNGRFQLRHQGTPGQAYSLQATADFQDWETLSDSTYPENGIAEFIDGDSADWPYRFYRLLH